MSTRTPAARALLVAGVLALAACSTTGPTAAPPQTEAPPTVSAPLYGLPAPATTPPASSSPTLPASPGRCHYRPGAAPGAATDPLLALPDPVCTPGARNAAVTADGPGYKHTICLPGYTKTIRPPVSVTQKIKARLLTAYGLPQSAETTTELDHLLPLELGGDPGSDANLWTQRNYDHPHPSSFDHNPKDPTENVLKRAVCAGQVTLAAAQDAEVRDWTTALSVLGLK